MEKRAWRLGRRPKLPFAAVGYGIVAQPDAERIERRAPPPLRLLALRRIGKRG